MKTLLLIPLLLLAGGCAYLRSSTSTNTKTGEITTVVRSFTFFDSQAALTKFANRGTLTESNQWAPGTTINSLNQSSASTNLNDLLGAVVSAAVRAGISSTKP